MSTPPFVLGRVLGEGGMGQVYEAHDSRLGRKVALKLLHPSAVADPTARERLMREAAAGAALQHPNIAAVYSVEEIDRRSAIVMEFVPGQSMRARVSQGPMPPEQVLDFGLQALSGLAAAHAQGIVHRDIKPDNLMLTPDGRLKITDFGLAKLLNTTSVLTQEGQWVGTPAYLAPEQLLNASVDHRADLFSLGATLYEAATGRGPFMADREMAVLYAVLNEDPPAFAELGVEAPEGLESVLRMALRKEPELRYVSAEAMAADLLRVLEHQHEHREGPPVLQAAKMEARPSGGSHALPFVGRAAELETLAQALRQAASAGAASAASADAARVVLVAGEAGAGKSRLAGEALERANFRGRQRLLGRASPETRGNPYGPFTDALGGYLRAIGVSGREQLRAYAESREGLSDSDLPGLEALFLGGTEAGRPAGREQLWGALRALLHSISQERPTALLLEDIHWADSESWALLAYLARSGDAPPLAIVGTYRPEDLAASTGQDPAFAESFHELRASSRCREVEVSRLDVSALQELATAFLVEGRPSEALLEILARQSEGNIFMALEFLRYLSEEKLLVRHNGTWDSGLSAEARLVPPRVQELVLRRVARLPQNLRELLEVAAVAGEWFHASTVVAASGAHRIHVLRGLQALEREHRLVWAQEGRYRFDHARVRDVVYESLDAELRQEFHWIIGQQMLEEFGEVREYAGPIARHFMRSGHAREALPYLLRAADNARRLFANQDALESYQELLRVIDGLPPAHRAAHAETARAALAGLADVQVLLGDYATAASTYEQLRAAAQAAGDAAREAAGWRGLGTVHERQSRYEEAEAAYSASLHICEAHGDGEQRAWALAGLGSVYLCRDQFDPADRAYHQALDLLQGLGNAAGVATCLNNLGHVHLYRAQYAQAAELYAQSLERRRALGDRRAAMASLNNLAHILTGLGRPAEATTALEEGLELARDIGDRFGQAMLLYNQARLLYETGRLEEALEAARTALEANRALGDQMHIATSQMVLGSALLGLGRRAEARAELESAMALSREVGNQEDEARALCGLSIAVDDPAEGERLASSALELARRIASPEPEMRALVSLSALALAAGAAERARGLAREALALARRHDRAFYWAEAALLASWGERELGHAEPAEALRLEALEKATQSQLEVIRRAAAVPAPAKGRALTEPAPDSPQ